MSTHQRPPSPGRVTGWRPDTGPELAEAGRLLGTAELTVEGRLPWSSNLTYLVRLGGTGPGAGDDEGAGAKGGTPGPCPLLAVYKPHRGERSLWDFPDGLYRREVAAHALSEALGWGLVPPTVLRHDGPFGVGSLQLFVEADYEQHYFTFLEEGDREDELKVFCAFDVVANNADRKSGHVLHASDGRLWGIDHGLCFHSERKLRTVIWDFAGEAVPGTVLADLERFLADGLPDDLTALLHRAECESLLDRAARLVEDGVFPEPAGDWHPYPWPLV